MKIILLDKRYFDEDDLQMIASYSGFGVLRVDFPVTDCSMIKIITI